MSDGNIRVPEVSPEHDGREVDCRTINRGIGDRFIQRVELVDRNGDGITDSVEHALVVSDIDHFLIHAGKTWVLSNTASVLAAANLDFLIVNNSTGALHVKDFTFASSLASADIEFYRDTTVSANGTLQILQNKSWGHQENTPYANIYLGPTITAIGTLLEHFQIIGGKQTGGTVLGGGDEWVIPVNRKGLLRFTNNAAQTDSVSYTIKVLDV